uniref:Uncharacterized protein n=1 Tax=Schimmelmannia schousboei TaxID=173468 RepID=A0A1C9C8N3_9FLOR|nr:hypothetical protein Schim_054 [Schimmelmannia schousboei]AOM64735.1 hypothetical protein Schim_054 [Schimmelmannia schousboei]
MTNNKTDTFTGVLQKIVGHVYQNYQFQINQNGYLKIKSTKDQITYIEHIYYISDNLRISITKLKRLNNYIAIAFTSYIKIIKSDQ